MFYFTADPHMHFDDIIRFSSENGLDGHDIISILGDAGFNHFLDDRDRDLKKKVSKNIKCKLFMSRGNHDARIKHVGGYEQVSFLNGIAYAQPEYPNLIFADEYGFYDFHGVNTFVIGGAKTIKPEDHIANGHPVYEDEALSEGEQFDVEWTLENNNWQVDLVLTHSCPQSFIKPSMLFPGYDQHEIDHSVELWLDIIEKSLDYKYWLFGHFHKDIRVNERAQCLRHKIISLKDLNLA